MFKTFLLTSLESYAVQLEQNYVLLAKTTLAVTAKLKLLKDF
jgi:hypothetical protein